MAEEGSWEGWHFLPGDGRLWGKGKLPETERIEVHAGVTYRIEGTPRPCKHGLHASRRAVDALGYAPNAQGLIICRVRLGGTIMEDFDKACATERTVLWMADATRALHEFAMWCAEGALTGSNVRDERPWRALEVKRRWLDGQATDEELAIARAAAQEAARAADDTGWAATVDAAVAAAVAASRFPRDAARVAAVAAAVAAARAAARAAAVVARDAVGHAVGHAAGDAAGDELERRLLALGPAVTP